MEGEREGEEKRGNEPVVLLLGFHEKSPWGYQHFFELFSLVFLFLFLFLSFFLFLFLLNAFEKKRRRMTKRRRRRGQKDGFEIF